MSTPATCDPLEDLPSQVLTVYKQLVTFTDPVTVDDIAQAAATPRSSTFKALVALEKRGLAGRERGIQNGPHRRPDLWHPTHTKPVPPDGSAPKTPAPAEATAAPSTMAELSVGTTAAETTDAPAPDNPGTAERKPQASSEEPEEPLTREEIGTAETTAPAAALPAPRTATEAVAPAAQPVTGVSDGGKRLAPGHLRQLVLDHLNTHPGQAFTATRISPHHRPLLRRHHQRPGHPGNAGPGRTGHRTPPHLPRHDTKTRRVTTHGPTPARAGPERKNGAGPLPIPPGRQQRSSTYKALFTVE